MPLLHRPYSLLKRQLGHLPSVPQDVGQRLGWLWQTYKEVSGGGYVADETAILGGPTQLQLPKILWCIVYLQRSAAVLMHHKCKLYAFCALM